MDVPWFRRLFLRFFGIWMRSRIGALRIRMHQGVHGIADLPRPVILAANHLSWWDGFLLAQVHARFLPRHRLMVVMNEQELKKRRWMRWLGATPLDPQRVWSFRRLLSLLEERAETQASIRVCILYFPQGRLWPSHKRPLGFQRGIELLLQHLGPAQVIPVGLHFDWDASSKPTAWISAGEALAESCFSALELETRVARELDSVQDLLAAEGENAAAVSKARGFETMWGLET